MSEGLIPVRLELREVTLYTRVVLMSPAEVGRVEALLATGDPEAQAEVAEAMFDKFVDKVLDECEDDPNASTATVTRLTAQEYAELRGQAGALS